MKKKLPLTIAVCGCILLILIVVFARPSKAQAEQLGGRVTVHTGYINMDERYINLEGTLTDRDEYGVTLEGAQVVSVYRNMNTSKEENKYERVPKVFIPWHNVRAIVNSR